MEYGGDQVRCCCSLCVSGKKLVCLFCFKEAEDGRHNVDARGRLNVFKRVFLDRAERRRGGCSKTFASASFHAV